MRREIENLKTEEELENELMALKLKMALRQYQEDKLARMMAEHDDDAAGKERLANGQDEMIRRIDRQLRKRQARRFARKTLPRFGKIAACLLLTFYVGLTVAVAAVQSVRVELLQFILSIEEKYKVVGGHTYYLAAAGQAIPNDEFLGNTSFIVQGRWTP